MTKHTETKQHTGAGLAIGAEEVRAAYGTLQKYRAAKAKLERRMEENEDWFRMRHWAQLRRESQGEKKASAWLFNAIMNKHADFMDAAPECTVLPREPSDTAAAEALTSVLPVILERCDFGSVFSEAAYRKLKAGTAVYSVLWDAAAENGLGDVSIRCADLFSLYWEPGVKDIQKSRNLFCLELEDNDLLLERYPFLEGKLGGASAETAAYLYDKDVDTANKSTVVDWYYKKRVGSKTVVHYVKFVNDTVLFASENDPAYAERGWYDHGLYPFVFDPLFPEEGTPVGFGFIDVMKDAQEEIDILGNEILKNARVGARRRYFVRGEGSVNEAEFADLSRDFVHVNGSSLGEDSLREIAAAPLHGVYVTVLNNKIAELKETTGNRDFTAGGTAGGVTSGTAIAALQEAGSKLSRDMISASYRAFTGVCALTIELIRQFYTVPRSMRILGPNGEWQFTDYDNSALLPRRDEQAFGVDFAGRKPVFDLSVKAHKQNVFSRAAQNSDALNFYKLGFFDPANSVASLACLQLIDIDDKEKLMHIIEENGRRFGAVAGAPGTEVPAQGPLYKNIRDRLAAAQRGDAAP